MAANEKEMLRVAGELHKFLHDSLELPPRRMIRRARALGHEALESEEEIA